MDEQTRIRTRMRFVKTGRVRYVGHLDLMRFFQKAIRRAELNVAYSQGFSPHQLMSFAAPLGLGQTTDGDYLDVEFEWDETYASDPELIKERLNAYLTDEVYVTEIELLPPGCKSSMSMLRTCDYLIIDKNHAFSDSDYTEKFEAFIAQPEIPVTKKTKRSEKVIDLKPAILKHAYSAEGFEEETGETLPELHPIYSGDSLWLRLPADSAGTVKPDIVLEAFFAFCDREYDPLGVHIHRINMHF